MSLLTDERRSFHRALIDSGVLVIDDKGIASNADVSQRTSRDIAIRIADTLGAVRNVQKLPGQSAGGRFETAVADFLNCTLPHFKTLRPGRWNIKNLGGLRRENPLALYEPYSHLDDLAKAIKRDATLTSVMGNSYSISPDILITRSPEPDEFINSLEVLVDDECALLAPIREHNQTREIVHAIVSCKWTLRSDRAQNARSEALSLIRNRKGRTPHIAVVTGEPSPSRIASLALGTGDIDCMYHFALPELCRAVEETDNDEAQVMLKSLVEGQRLRDLSDLVLDLSV